MSPNYTSTINYPNGQTLLSSALTVEAMDGLLNTLTCGVLGITPPDPQQVRIAWQTQGQPFQNVKTDAVYIEASLTDNPYNEIRDKELSGVNTNWTYTRVWRVTWIFYGPNSFDRARALRSATWMDWFNDQLNQQSLFPVAQPAEAIRHPEEINKQWYQRADFSLELYEQVFETVTEGKAVTVDIEVLDSSGVVDVTFTVT